MANYGGHEGYGFDTEDDQDGELDDSAYAKIAEKLDQENTLGQALIRGVTNKYFGDRSIDPFSADWGSCEGIHSAKILHLGPSINMLVVKKQVLDPSGEEDRFALHIGIVRNTNTDSSFIIPLTAAETDTLILANENELAIPATEAFELVQFNSESDQQTIYRYQLHSVHIAQVINKLSIFGLRISDSSDDGIKFEEATLKVVIKLPSIEAKPYWERSLGQSIQNMRMTKLRHEEWYEKMQVPPLPPIEYQLDDECLATCERATDEASLAEAIASIPGIGQVISAKSITWRINNLVHSWNGSPGDRRDTKTKLNHLLNDLGIIEILEGQDDSGLFSWNNAAEVVAAIGRILPPWEAGKISLTTIHQLAQEILNENELDQTGYIKTGFHARSSNSNLGQHSQAIQYSRELAQAIVNRYLQNPTVPSNWVGQVGFIDLLAENSINISRVTFEEALENVEWFFRNVIGIDMGVFEYTQRDARAAVDPEKAGYKHYCLSGQDGKLYFRPEFVYAIAEILKNEPGIDSSGRMYSQGKPSISHEVLQKYKFARYLPWLLNRLTNDQIRYLAALARRNSAGQHPNKEDLAESLSVSTNAVLPVLRSISSSLTPSAAFYNSDGMRVEEDNFGKVINIMIQQGFQLESLNGKPQDGKLVYLGLKIVKYYVENGVVPSRELMIGIARGLGIMVETVSGVDKLVAEFIRANNMNPKNHA
jgi:hypothetical protein